MIEEFSRNTIEKKAIIPKELENINAIINKGVEYSTAT